MIEGKILWLEPEDKDTAAQEAEAHVVIKDGRMVKNRFGAIAPNEEKEKAMKREIHLRLMAGVLSGPPIDVEDGKGPMTPLEKMDLIMVMCADDADEVFETWANRGWL